MRESGLERGINGLIVDLSLLSLRGRTKKKKDEETHFGFCQDEHVGVLCFDVEFESLSILSTLITHRDSDKQHTFF